MAAAPPKTVVILGSLASSLVAFRGSLIAAIIRQGHRVIAAAPSMDQRTSEALKALGAEPREIPLENASLSPIGLQRSVSAVRALFRKEQPDVVIAYTIKPVIASAAAGAAERVPTIVSLITGVGYAFTGGHEPKRIVSRAAASILYRLAFSRSHVIVFQNHDDERLFRRLSLIPGNRKTHVVNGSGVDLETFSPAPLPQQTAFLMIARLLKDKGIREFAAAAKQLKAAYPRTQVTLVGDFDPSPDSLSRDELDELIGCGIRYLGRLDDVRAAIADCNVYVLPSYREGTPRSVLEAMAMGRAIITTDAPGCRETVVDGDNGILVPPRDSDSLFEAMMRFVDDPALAPRMGAKSRKLAEAKFDVRKVNADLLRYIGLGG